MFQKTYSQQESEEISSQLPSHTMRKLVDHYWKESGFSLDKEVHQAITNSLQSQLEKYDIHCVTRAASPRMLSKIAINRPSFKSMQIIMKKIYGYEGINIKIVWFWRKKLIHTLSQMKMPTLSRIVRVDETLIRESQGAVESLYLIFLKTH